MNKRNKTKLRGEIIAQWVRRYRLRKQFIVRFEDLHSMILPNQTGYLIANNDDSLLWWNKRVATIGVRKQFKNRLDKFEQVLVDEFWHLKFRDFEEKIGELFGEDTLRVYQKAVEKVADHLVQKYQCKTEEDK